MRQRRHKFNQIPKFMITKDGKDTAIEHLTAENYLVPKGEEKFYHCIIEVRQFDPKTGKRISSPRVQKFGRKVFDSIVRSSLLKQGYEVTILHNPNEWAKAHAAEVAASRKAAAEAKAKAEQEKFDAAVAAAVAKALAAKEKADEEEKERW